ncbi:MAG: hypothetical protein ABI665_07905 [Vicinamibacterales bacterium]
MSKFVLLSGIAWFAFGVTASAAELPKALVEPYLQAQVLLANDETKGIDVAAQAVEAAALKLGKKAEAVAAGAKKLGAARTLSQSRTAFGELSVALEDYVTRTKATLPKDLHVAYCPMEDKPWLQKGDVIHNPYYGSEMIDCGTIKK